MKKLLSIFSLGVGVAFAPLPNHIGGMSGTYMDRMPGTHFGGASSFNRGSGGGGGHH